MNPKAEYSLLGLIILFGTALRFILSHDPISVVESTEYLFIAYGIDVLGKYDPFTSSANGNRLIIVGIVAAQYNIFGISRNLLVLTNSLSAVISLSLTYKFSKDVTGDGAISLVMALLHSTIPIELVWAGAGTAATWYGTFTVLFFWLYFRARDERWAEQQRAYLYFSGLVSYIMISLLAIGFLVYLAVAFHILRYERHMIRIRMDEFGYMLYGFLNGFVFEGLYYFAFTINPFFGLLKRLGFDVGDEVPLDVGPTSFEGQFDSIRALPSAILIPYWLGFTGAITLIAIFYFSYSNDPERSKLSTWILGKFFFLQWFPVFLITDPIGVISGRKPLTFNKHAQYFMMFTSLGLVVLAAFYKELEAGLPEMRNRFDRDFAKHAKYIKRALQITIPGLILTNLMLASMISPSVTGESHFRDLVNYFDENDVGKYYVDVPDAIVHLVAASDFRHNVRSAATLEEVLQLSCTHYVANTSSIHISNLEFDPLDLPGWEVAQTYHSEYNPPGFLTQDSFNYTTVIYRISC